MRTLETMLPEHPFLRGIAPHHLELIAGCASNVVFQPGEYIFREGEDADRFYGIRHGRAAIEVFAAGRGAISIQTVDEGEMLGWSWLVPPYTAHFDVRALELTRATAFDGECLRRKCASDPSLGYELMTRVCELVVQRLDATRIQLLDVYGHRDHS